ncbi:hypothetical protein B0H11DRAFT_1922010 [Mycena galericulata]|nr:hypothetical protein B0H11DRAFT_1922010 [Mycena galericulata]
MPRSYKTLDYDDGDEDYHPAGSTVPHLMPPRKNPGRRAKALIAADSNTRGAVNSGDRHCSALADGSSHCRPLSFDGHRWRTTSPPLATTGPRWLIYPSSLHCSPSIFAGPHSKAISFHWFTSAQLSRVGQCNPLWFIGNKWFYGSFTYIFCQLIASESETDSGSQRGSVFDQDIT